MPEESADPQLSDTLARMGAVLLSDATVDAVLGLIVDLAVDALADVDAASITLRRADTEETASASSELALELDEAQYAADRGPCLTAARTGERLAVDIEPGDPRWPEYADVAVERGFRSSLSVPLLVASAPTGALNTYSRRSFDESSTRSISMFAEQASVVVANALSFMQAELLNQQLQEALASREIIGQAKGILMAREGVDADRAFDMLRRASQRSNRKLRDIAQDIVAANSQGPQDAPSG